MQTTTRRFQITDTLSLVDGDIFSSQMQTLAVPVNTVGVMGKGLALQIKEQFPDIDVFYRDLCRQRKLLMGRPYLYRRALSFDGEDHKWFLLFPTKYHWRDKSNIKNIADGLAWVFTHYAQEKISSLAVPALGCGLGGLSWYDVGPLMCKYLAHLNIQVSIYLPNEKELHMNS